MIIETTTPEDVANTLAHRDGVVEKLTDLIDEYLEFGSTRQLMKLIVDRL